MPCRFCCKMIRAHNFSFRIKGTRDFLCEFLLVSPYGKITFKWNFVFNLLTSVEFTEENITKYIIFPNKTTIWQMKMNWRLSQFSDLNYCVALVFTSFLYLKPHAYVLNKSAYHSQLLFYPNLPMNAQSCLMLHSTDIRKIVYVDFAITSCIWASMDLVVQNGSTCTCGKSKVGWNWEVNL